MYENLPNSVAHNNQDLVSRNFLASAKPLSSYLGTIVCEPVHHQKICTVLPLYM